MVFFSPGGGDCPPLPGVQMPPPAGASAADPGPDEEIVVGACAPPVRAAARPGRSIPASISTPATASMMRASRECSRRR